MNTTLGCTRNESLPSSDSTITNDDPFEPPGNSTNDPTNNNSNNPSESASPNEAVASPNTSTGTTIISSINATNGTVFLNCDCGSTLADEPCLGTTVRHSRALAPLPESQIDFQFECDGGPCACGKFANQYDYWVAPQTPSGTVKIIGMSPTTVGTANSTLRNGWIANPPADVLSTFMDGRLGSATNTGVPLNPTVDSPLLISTATIAITTIVKSHSMLETGLTSCGGTDTTTGLSRHCFWQAGVLTILDRVPTDNGSTVFRPPITGSEKPLISTSLINHGGLPNLQYPTRASGEVVTGKTWEYALDRMGPPKVEWGARGDWSFWQYMPPMYNFTINASGYPPRTMEGLLDSLQLLAIAPGSHEQDKRLLTIRAVQWGYDYYYMWKTLNYGAMYKPNGGHAVGRYLPTIIAAALTTGTLGDKMKSDLMKVNNGSADKCGFDISGELFYWSDTDRILYGYYNIVGCGGYTDYTKQTNSNYVDPSHIGDNGRLAINTNNSTVAVNSCFGAYQAITVGPTQTSANLIRAIPAARAIAYSYMIPYVSRMFDYGAYCRPDHTPSAIYIPAFGTCVGGVNISEQCRNNSDCPSSTCTGNNNQYTSWLARNMWAKYKNCYDNNSCPGM